MIDDDTVNDNDTCNANGDSSTRVITIRTNIINKKKMHLPLEFLLLFQPFLSVLGQAMWYVPKNLAVEEVNTAIY